MNWYGYDTNTLSESDITSLKKKYSVESSMVRELSLNAYGNAIDTNPSNILRSPLQANAKNVGGVLDFVNNAATIKSDSMLAAQRAMYGGLVTNVGSVGRRNADGSGTFDSVSALKGKPDDSVTHDSSINQLLDLGVKMVFGGNGTGNVNGKENNQAADNIITELLAATGSGSLGDLMKNGWSKALTAAAKDLADKTGKPVSASNVVSLFSTGAKAIADSTLDEVGEIKARLTSETDLLKSSFASGFTFDNILNYSKIQGKRFLQYMVGLTDTLGGTGDNFSNVRQRIMLMPYTMTDIIDPNGREYTNNVMSTQHVVTVVPGFLDEDGFKFFTSYGITNASINAEIDALTDSNEGTASTMLFDTSNALASIIQLSSDKNHRIGVFKPQIWGFLRIYSTLMGRFMSRLSAGNTFLMPLDNNSLVTSGWGGFQFALNNNTTVMESGSNSFTDSPVANMMGNMSGIVRHMNALKQSLVGLESDDPAKSGPSTGGGNNITAALQGQQQNFPKFWDNSDFTRSYTLNFRLESPYGDPESLLTNVYKPLSVLLSMSLPVYRSMYGYDTPFCLRVDCPGWFSIDCGYVSSIDIRKAPDDSSWNAHGVATNIEVNMSIVDIYPALALSAGPSGLGKNFGLQAYIDNLTGMDYREIYSGGSFSNSLRSRIIMARMLPGMVKSTFLAKATEKSWRITTPGYIR